MNRSPRKHPRENSATNEEKEGLMASPISQSVELCPLHVKEANLGSEELGIVHASEIQMGDSDVAWLNRVKQMPNKSDSERHPNDDYTLWELGCGRCGNLCGYPAFDEEDLQNYGIGVYLYFSFLSKLFYLFMLLTLVMVPMMVLCYNAEQTPPSATQFEQLTLANLGPFVAYNHSTMGMIGGDKFPTKGFPMVDNPMRKADAGKLFGILDLATAVLVLLFLQLVGSSNRNLTLEIDDDETTVKDYALRITGLPMDVFSRREIQAFFEKDMDVDDGFFRGEPGPLWGGKGSVADVAISFNDGEIYDEYRAKARIREAMTNATAKDDKAALESLKLDLHRKNAQIEQMEENFDRWTVAAYVTFNKELDKVEVLKSYPGGCCANCCMPYHLRFRGEHRITVQEADEPSNINFKNQKYSPCDLRARRCISTLASILIIMVSIGAIFGVQAYSDSLPKPGTVCEKVVAYGFDLPKNYDAQMHNCTALGNTTIYDMDTTTGQYMNFPANRTHKSPNETIHNTTMPNCQNLHKCYCYSAPYPKLLKDYGKGRCKTIAKDRMTLMGLMVGGSILVIVVNIILTTLMQAFVHFEKHVSKTSEEVALTWKLFIGLFFNTGMVVTLVNAGNPKVRDMLPIKFLFNGRFEDFTPEWYTAAGTTLMITMLANTLNPHIVQVVMWPVEACFRSRAAGDDENKVTQTELDSAYEPGDFILSERYAAIANTFYVAYLYSSAMPLLIPVAMVTFYFMHWFDLVGFLRLYKKPPKYDAHLANFSLSLLKPAVYLHLAVSIWVYGSDAILHHDKLDGGQAKITAQISGGFGKLQDVMFNMNTLFASLFLLGLASWELVLTIADVLRLTDLLMFMVATFCNLLGWLCCLFENCCCCCPCYSDWMESSGPRIEGNDDFPVAMKYINFESYHICDQARYKAAFSDGCMPRTAPLFTDNREPEIPTE